MVKIDALQGAGLTEGESKVYLALLKLGTTTSGPIIEKSNVSNSIIYRILNSLIEKGLVSCVTKEKTKYFRAANPKRILDYLEERKEKIDQNKQTIEMILPQLTALTQPTEDINVQMYKGFKGVISAWELTHSELRKGDEFHSWGVYPMQEDRFHLYWQRDHKKREKAGFGAKILFNRGTDKETLENRNSYNRCEARYMPNEIKTPAWFVVFKNITIIVLQTRKFEENQKTIEKPTAIVIESKEIAETFEAYFQDLWKRSSPFKN